MKFLDNKALQVYFDKIHVFILSGMSTNKAAPFKLNGYSAIYANEKAENIHSKNLYDT